MTTKSNLPDVSGPYATSHHEYGVAVLYQHELRIPRFSTWKEFWVKSFYERDHDTVVSEVFEREREAAPEVEHVRPVWACAIGYSRILKKGGGSEDA